MPGIVSRLFPRFLVAPGLALLMLVTGPAGPTRADDSSWTNLTDQLDSATWTSPTGAWYVAGDARLDPENERRLVGLPGTGVIINGPTGRTTNLATRQSYADVELHCEFLVPKGSNSGVKFEGLYEIQILDSHGVSPPKAQDCGGIYPRAELLPRYHYLDEGHPPLVNACLQSGQWQTLDVLFLAPRFDESGKKTQNARVVRATLNGQVIHQNLDLLSPTGHAWSRQEPPSGPILLQADHGPVAFRNVRVRQIAASEADALRAGDTSKPSP
jgi:hypothetical protein